MWNKPIQITDMSSNSLVDLKARLAEEQMAIKTGIKYRPIKKTPKLNSTSVSNRAKADEQPIESDPKKKKPRLSFTGDMCYYGEGEGEECEDNLVDMERKQRIFEEYERKHYRPYPVVLWEMRRRGEGAMGLEDMGVEDGMGVRTVDGEEPTDEFGRRIPNDAQPIKKSNFEKISDWQRTGKTGWDTNRDISDDQFEKCLEEHRKLIFEVSSEIKTQRQIQNDAKMKKELAKKARRDAIMQNAKMKKALPTEKANPNSHNPEEKDPNTLHQTPIPIQSPSEPP